MDSSTSTTTSTTPAPKRESGRPCGCDRGADYICAGHEKARDETLTTLGINLDVSGPTASGLFKIFEDDQLVMLTRWEAEDVIAELQRRLNLRGNA